jgi:hypothetical protein
LIVFIRDPALKQFLIPLIENILRELINIVTMKGIKILREPVFILILVLLSTNIYSQFKTNPGNKTAARANPVEKKYGALAIDRSNGFYYGWASDCSTLPEAEKKALDVCSKKGGRCSIVLSFSGTGCAAYRFITGNVGTGFGWGLAKTKEEADIKAKKECQERSFGLPAPNIVWSCNSENSGDLKEIYNAHDEIVNAPGIVTNY